MANAKRKTGEEFIKLTLTLKEAEALQRIFRSVGGHPETSPRGDIDRIMNALYDADVRPCNRETTGSIYFKD